MRKRAQTSVEFIAVSAIGMLLVVAIGAFYVNFAKGNEDAVRMQQVTSVGATIISQAQNVYSYGKNNWVTIDARIPDKVSAIYTVEGKALVFDVETSYGTVSQPVFSLTPITGVQPIGSKIHVNNASMSIHSGNMRFRATSLGGVVEIQAVS